MISLLDVSVLIALVDADHAGHETAHQWFSGARHEGWATCPITENGVVRILGGSSYPNSPGLAAVIELVRSLRLLQGHMFWPDAVSLFDLERFRLSQLSSSTQITDVYLLGLAVSREAKFVTFDQRIAAQVAPGGFNALQVLSK